jgi:hypothetical protein
VLGGASVGEGEALLEAGAGELDLPDALGVPAGPEELAELEELEELEDPAPACTVGWGFEDALACACRWCLRAAWVAAAADVDGCRLGVVAVWLVVWAGAVRANKVARPTAVTALSCVARQVSRDRRRRPAVRASPG